MKFLLFSISLLVTLLFFSFTSNAATLDSVRDTDGHPLISGKQYYIIPVVRGHGGGLTMTTHNYLHCPLYVAQENMEVKKGIPLIFRPANPKDKVVRLSTDINIEFAIITTCVMPTTWQLRNIEGAGKRYITTGGLRGKPGRETVNIWFKIEKLGNKAYKLVFCPSVCTTCKVVCGDVGVFNEGGGKRLLGLSGEHFPVMFKKLKDS
ncbi:miraculin-like [Carex rostrata]